MPGPDIIYVIVQSITNSKKHGIATAFGLGTGVVIHTALVAFGVSLIVKQSESLFFILKLFGALYLFYLAYASFKDITSYNFDSNKAADEKLIKLFKQGFIMNVLNPKVSIFFLAFLPQFLFDKELTITIQIIILGGLFMMVSVLIFSFVAILAGSFAKYLRSGKAAVYGKWFKVSVFIALGFYILFSN
jgi:threonine/homoserine/homoserine lactone efflux protein